LKRATTSTSRRALLALALALAGGAAVGTLGCESGFDRNDQIVNSVRILGVRTQVANVADMDLADSDAGDMVEFSALVANPNNDPSVTVTWLACIPIPGQISPCTYAGTLRDPTTLISMANDPSTGVILLGTGNPIAYTIPQELQTSLMDLITRADDSLNAECGIFMEIPLIVIAEGSDNKPFTAQKNIRLSPWREIGKYSTDAKLKFYITNTNPGILALNLSPTSVANCDGTPLASPCAADSDCAATTGGTCGSDVCSTATTFPTGPQVVCLALDEPQSYYNCTLDGPDVDYAGQPPNVPEKPAVTWYMTGGALSAFTSAFGSGGDTASRTYTGFIRPAGPFTLYGVVRDGRDGQSWIAQDFQ
jgi:hypothetical protein